ncbi:hypothetical protein DFH06DRAFT_1104944 [Mycena polygramma]|nr:hypothetical protein DFH06DRAFT_1104944 [Mycena polygramma]
MHHSLGIPELVALIFAELQCPYPHENLSHRDLAALARTCKTFQEPALDLLWREQTTLANVLRCLPSYLWQEKESFGWYSCREFSILGPIRTADWNVPLSYASRIQKLALSDSKFHTADIFETIRSGLPCDYLCPNLKRLVFQLNTDSLFPSIHLFLGPKVVDVYMSSPPSSRISSLSGLPLRCWDLKRLSMVTYSWQHDDLLLATDSEIALSLERIEDLDVDKLDRAAIEHLSRLPTLQSLSLYSPHSRHFEPSSRCPSRTLEDSPRHLFPVLRDLCFSDTTFDFVLEFLDMLTDGRLAGVYIGTSDAVAKTATGQLYAALASHLSHTALQILSVKRAQDSEIDTPPAGTITNYVVDRHSLQTLFCFANLTDLHLQPPVGFDLNDVVAWEMARAWPKLTTLCLDAATDFHYPSSISIHGLRAFAKHCDDLASLSITLDASTVPLDVSSESIAQSTLTCLNIGLSPITDPLAVAHVLSELFPNLACVHHDGDWVLSQHEMHDDDRMAEMRIDAARWKEAEARLPRVVGKNA